MAYRAGYKGDPDALEVHVGGNKEVAILHIYDGYEEILQVKLTMKEAAIVARDLLTVNIINAADDEEK